MAKNNKAAAPATNNNDLTAQIDILTQEKAATVQIANIAAQQLLYIQSRLSPLLTKKFNVWNALFHIREFVELVREIVNLIQEFKDKFVNRTTDDTPK